MNDILFFSAIVIVGDIVGTYIQWLIFKNTIGYYLIKVIAIIAPLVAILTYIIAKEGVIHSAYLIPVAIVLVSLSVVWFTKKVTKPIKELTKLTNLLAKGKLDVQIDNELLKRKEEIGMIALSFETMVNQLKQSVKIAELIGHGQLHSAMEKSDKITTSGDLDLAIKSMIIQLNETIKKIIDTTSALSSGAEQIRSSSQSVATGANEQAVSLEEISASIEQITTSAQQNSTNSIKAKEVAESTKNKAGQVQNASDEAVVMMQTIAEKIYLIQDIAKKTDILAINASIEATRAKEEGKGFRAVATEVRKLAENSAQVATLLIDYVKKLSESVQRSGLLLHEALPDLEKTKELVEFISISSQEQLSGIQQVSAAITQLNNVTQNNSASAEEMASSSILFSEMSENLQNSIRFFKLDKDEEEGLRQEIEEKIKEMQALIERNFEKSNNKQNGIVVTLDNEDKELSDYTENIQ